MKEARFGWRGQGGGVNSHCGERGRRDLDETEGL